MVYIFIYLSIFTPTCDVYSMSEVCERFLSYESSMIYKAYKGFEHNQSSMHSGYQKNVLVNIISVASPSPRPWEYQNGMSASHQWCHLWGKNTTPVYNSHTFTIGHRYSKDGRV